MTTEYTPVAWPDVRKGDVLMHENGDRLTVTDVLFSIRDRADRIAREAGIATEGNKTGANSE